MMLTALVAVPQKAMELDIEDLLLTLRFHCDSAEAALYKSMNQDKPEQFPAPGGHVPRSRSYTLARILHEMEVMGYELREDVPAGEAWRAVYAKNDADRDPIVGECFCHLSAHVVAYVFANQRAGSTIQICN
jgi:uncharacterized glyoxalase superfamily metalloenzyme YdcJ